MTRGLLLVVLLTGVYLLTLGKASPADVAVGAVISIGVLALLRGFLFEHDEPAPLHGPLRRLAAFPVFAWAVVRDVVGGTREVAGVVLGLRPLAAGVVEVPIGDRTRSGVAVTGVATTLSPGAVLLDVDWERGVMLFHMLDVRDQDAVIARQQDFYERYQRRVFP